MGEPARKKKITTNRAARNQFIIKAGINAQKQRTPSIEGTLAGLQKLTNSAVDRAWFTEKLFEVENAGLLKDVIGNG